MGDLPSQDVTREELWGLVSPPPLPPPADGGDGAASDGYVAALLGHDVAQAKQRARQAQNKA